MGKPSQNVLEREAGPDARLPRSQAGLLCLWKWGDTGNLEHPPATPEFCFPGTVWGGKCLSKFLTSASVFPPTSTFPCPLFQNPGCCVCFCPDLTLPDPDPVQAFMLSVLPHSSLLHPSVFICFSSHSAIPAHPLKFLCMFQELAASMWPQQAF